LIDRPHRRERRGTGWLFPLRTSQPATSACPQQGTCRAGLASVGHCGYP
jgi:hypothetical protein